MKKYLIVKLVFEWEILPEVYDIWQEEYQKATKALEALADTLGAALFFEDHVNTVTSGRSFAAIEHNFWLSEKEKSELVRQISRFFVDGEIRGGTMSTHQTLAAVRFLQCEGELLAP